MITVGNSLLVNGKLSDKKISEVNLTFKIKLKIGRKYMQTASILSVTVFLHKQKINQKYNLVILLVLVIV